jgi:hypothetical protein
MDMKKLLNIVDGSVEKKQINESVEECGMPMSSSSPSSGNVSMNLSMNAQGVDNIKQLLDLMKAASAPTRMSEPMAMPSPGMDMPISITKIKPAGSDGPSGMAQIRDLISKADSPKPFENSPEEAYSDVDSVTTDAGGGVNGPKNPADIRIKDPSPYNATSEEFANEPDQQVSDHHTMIKDLSGGLNKEKQQYKKEYPGDNPMAVRESSIRRQLDAMWKEIKEGSQSNPALDAALKKQEQGEPLTPQEQRLIRMNTANDLANQQSPTKEDSVDETMYFDPKQAQAVRDIDAADSNRRHQDQVSAEKEQRSLQDRMARIGKKDKYVPGMKSWDVEDAERAYAKEKAARAGKL